VARSCTLAAAIGLAAAILASNVTAATPTPYLRSVVAVNRHVVAVFRLGTDLAPRQIVVAVSPKTEPNGALVSTNVRLRETIALTTHVPGGTRVKARHTLRPGRYWVQISAEVVGLDCLPAKPCHASWSNARALVIPK
jgi:hypothetical protein